MEGLMMRKKKTVPSSMQKSSQSKIRIIHIIEPEIIKTDAANFREVVQRLTGKPTTQTNCQDYFMQQQKKKKQKKKKKRVHVLVIERESKWKRSIDIANTEEGGFLGGFAECDPHPYEEPQLAN